MIDVSGIKEYFDYIKETYLKTFDKILNEDIKSKIINYKHDDIEIDDETEFNIKINGTIHYKMDIESFIKNNNLLNENLSDLEDSKRNQVKYILDNKDNKEKIIKDTLLENLILLFIPKRDILSYGMCTYLGNKFSSNCNLNTLSRYYKEELIIKKLIDILGEKEVLKSILNGDVENLKVKYDELNGSNTFSDIYNSLQKEFDYYYKNINKVYYIDSLYNYSNLNYDNIINLIDKTRIKKEEHDRVIELRINSILDSLKELERYMIILKEKEKNELYYSTLNIKRIVEKNNYSLYFNDILEIEKNLKSITDYIWNYYINYEGEYDPNSNYYFLVQNYNQVDDKDFTIMHLITNDHTRVPINKNRYKYGFVYKIKPGAIVYSSLDNIIYHETDIDNIKTFNVDNKLLEIEDQIYSRLLSPRNLFMKTLSENKEYNSVLVNKKYVTKRAVYSICKSENDIDYKKAVELANKYELPLIPLYESDFLK